MASNLDPQDAEACFPAVECDAFNQPGKGFSILRGDVGDHAIHDAVSTSKMPCLDPMAQNRHLVNAATLHRLDLCIPLHIESDYIRR